jgi:hypothetical protein
VIGSSDIARAYASVRKGQDRRAQALWNARQAREEERIERAFDQLELRLAAWPPTADALRRRPSDLAERTTR